MEPEDPRLDLSAVKSQWDQIAPEFASKRPTPWEQVRGFLSDLAPGSHILEIGSGPGRHIELAHAMGHSTLATDISPQMVRQVQGPRVVASWTHLPVRSGMFDAAIAVAVLHLLPSEAARLEALRTLASSVRAGGRILISIWARESDRFAGEQNDDVNIPWTLDDGSRVSRIYHLYSGEDLAELVGRVPELMVASLERHADNWWLTATSSLKRDG